MLMLSFFVVFSLYFFFDVLFFYFFSFVMFFFCLFLFSGFFDGIFYSDYISLLLIFISVWAFSLSISSLGYSFNGFWLYWLMFFFIVVAFFSSSFLIFYFSFEFVFSIMFFFLLGWGKTSERLQASFFMFFYTIVFSLPFLIMLVDLFLNFSSCFFILSFYNYDSFIWIFAFLVFIVKLPLFGFHLWLPKAHVESSVSGSMILASVFLKLGGYGILRFFSLFSLFSISNSFFISFIFYVSLYGALFLSLVCCRQMDMKMLIAYSSVVHMSFAMLGILSFTTFGMIGCLIMMISHGFVSSMLFFFMTEAYNIVGSRSMLFLKGFLSFFPVFIFFWFFGCFLNLGIPPFMSFFSEVLIIGSMSFLTIMEWCFIFFVCFFVGVYCVFLFSSLSYENNVFFYSYFLNLKTSLVGSCHLFFVILYPIVFFYF